MMKEISIADDFGYAQNLYFIGARMFMANNDFIVDNYTKEDGFLD